MPSSSTLSVYSIEEVARHNQPNDCWVALHGNIYNVTNFLDKHPGGRRILLKHVGTNATKEWDKFHQRHILTTVGKKYLIGSLGAGAGGEGEKATSRPSTSSTSSTAVESTSNNNNNNNNMKAAATTTTTARHAAATTSGARPPSSSHSKLSNSNNSSSSSSSSKNNNKNTNDDDEDLQGPFGDLIPYADPSWYQDFHSPYWDDSHRRVRNAMRTFVDEDILPYVHEWDEAKGLPRSLYLKAASLGIFQSVCGQLRPEFHKVPLPGGIPPEQWTAFHEYVVCDELSRSGSGGLVWGLIGGLGIGLPPVLAFGSPDLQHRVVPGCFDGTKNICLCVTEAHAGSDVANLKTEARKTPDGQHYILNGEKKWITNGAFADFFTVACRTGGQGMGGISLLLVERRFAGVKTRPMDCSGVWASGTGFITFEDVKVPVANLIGEENKGFKYIMYNFNHERLGIVIQCVRFSRVCFEEAIKHANKRKTFGKRLIQHDVIRNKLAHMAARIEPVHAWMESLMYQATQMSPKEQMLRLGGPIALLKAASTQMFEYCAREAAQIFGGLAYSRGGQAEKVERLYREVRAYAIPGGSEEIMLDLGIRQSLKVAQFLGAKL